MLLMLFSLSNIRFCLYRITINYLLLHFSILFIHKTIFKVFLFYIVTINLLNFDNHSRTLAFRKIKKFLYKYYPRFPKICKNRFLRFLRFLKCFLKSIFCAFIWLHVKHFEYWQPVKNANISQLRMGKNMATT